MSDKDIIISVLSVLKTGFQEANKVEIPCDEGLTVRKMTVEEKFDYMAKYIDGVMKAIDNYTKKKERKNVSNK